MNDRLDRAAGALVGVHLGDAVGSPWEFGSGDWLQREPMVGELCGGGPFGWRPGQPTDDTEQTILTGVALCEASESRLERKDHVLAVATGLVRWYRDGPKDVGTTTSGSLAALSRGRVAPDFCQRSIANGSLMRAAPVALLTSPGPDQTYLARKCSGVTHPNPIVGDLVLLYTRAVSLLVDEGMDMDTWATIQQEATAYLPELTGREHPREWGDESAIWTIGSAYTALRTALWALNLSWEYGPWEALLEVVRAGGDTDTTGAIAGGLLGAAYGLSQWKLSPGPGLLSQLEELVACEDLAHRLMTCRDRSRVS